MLLTPSKLKKKKIQESPQALVSSVDASRRPCRRPALRDAETGVSKKKKKFINWLTEDFRRCVSQ